MATENEENIKKFKHLASTTSMEPAERSQRQSIAAMMTELYVLRNKGFSWRQLSKMLADCNIRLLPTTIRVYYTEMLATRMDECQRRFNEYLVIMSEMKKVVGQTSLVDRAAGILEQQRLRTERNTNERQPLQDAHGQHVELPGNRPAIAPEPAPAPAPAPSSEYGLTVAATAPAVSKPGKPTFMGGNDSPPATPSARGGDLRCLALQDGMKILPRRANVDPLVYDSLELMEHPAIDGLMLSKAERLYGAYLEYADADGVVQIETIIQKNMRIKWERPYKNEPSSTEGDFVEMDMSLFPGKKGI